MFLIHITIGLVFLGLVVFCGLGAIALMPAYAGAAWMMLAAVACYRLAWVHFSRAEDLV